MTETLDLSFFVKPCGDNVRQMELAVEGVTCGGCIARIESGVKRVPGVIDARLNFTNRRLNVSWAEGAVQPAEIVGALERLGYRGHPFRPAETEAEEAAQSKLLLRCLSVAGFAAMNIMLLSVSVWSGNVTDITPETRDFFHWLSALIALPAAAYAGRPFFHSAWRAVRARRLNMDVPITLGVLLALALSVFETAVHAEHAYFDSAVMLLFFLLCGRYFDHAMRKRTRAAAVNLAALKTETAHRMQPDGSLIQVPVASLRPGDRVLVRPGERVPADGVILDGASEVDEGLVTGETLPRRVSADAALYAGSMNLGGALTLRVTAADENSLLQEIERLLEKAAGAKSRYVRMADRAARAYAPLVHATAALTLAGWLLAGAGIHDSVLAAVSVLIITCPCALALAIPVVQVAAAGRLFQAGVLLNTGDAVERLADVDTIVFDKTGTLTLPAPAVVNARAIEPALFKAASRLALSSRHPLAAALSRNAADQQPCPGAVEEPGRGVRATIDGIEARLGSPEFCDVSRQPAEDDAPYSVICFRHGDRVASFHLQQALRPDAARAVRSLAERGLDLWILSGDRATAVAPVAAELGIESWRAGLKPDGKLALLEQMKAEGRKVLMVGDGINDAPSLAAAHVSISPITAADLSQAQADAVFLGDRLDPVVDAVAVSRRAGRLMRQNLGLAVVYNAIAVPIAVAGLVTPLIAAAAMSGSSILVMLNALRLQRRGRPVPASREVRASESFREKAVPA